MSQKTKEIKTKNKRHTPKKKKTFKKKKKKRKKHLHGMSVNFKAR